MAKPKNQNKQETGLSKIDSQNSGLSLSANSIVPMLSKADFGAIFDKGNQRVELASREYYEVENTEGDVIQAILTGMGTMKSTIGGKEDKIIPTVEFQSDCDGEIKNYITASSKLTGIAATLGDLSKNPVAIEFTYLGKKKGNKGFMFDDFKISVLGRLGKQ